MIVAVAALIFVCLGLIGWCFWLTFDRQVIADRAEEASDNADKARTDVDELREQMRRPVTFADNAAAPVTEPITAQPAPDPGPPTVPAAEAITPQAIADDDWLAEQREWLDQQVAEAKAALFAAYPAPTAPTVRSTT